MYCGRALLVIDFAKNILNKYYAQSEIAYKKKSVFRIHTLQF